MILVIYGGLLFVQRSGRMNGSRLTAGVKGATYHQDIYEYYGCQYGGYIYLCRQTEYAQQRELPRKEAT